MKRQAGGRPDSRAAAAAAKNKTPTAIDLRRRRRSRIATGSKSTIIGTAGVLRCTFKISAGVIAR